ncbi:hypothetical protein [Mycolicibacterium sp. XJ1819]
MTERTITVNPTNPHLPNLTEGDRIAFEIDGKIYTDTVKRINPGPPFTIDLEGDDKPDPAARCQTVIGNIEHGLKTIHHGGIW